MLSNLFRYINIETCQFPVFAIEAERDEPQADGDFYLTVSADFVQGILFIAFACRDEKKKYSH